VLPDHRRKGLGSKLVKMCIEKAKSEALPLVVLSEPEAHGFCLKLGFEDTQQADIDLRKWAPELSGFGMFRVWGMVVKS